MKGTRNISVTVCILQKGWINSHNKSAVFEALGIQDKPTYIVKHLLSRKDQEFKLQVEACELPVSEFDHRAHIRLAYVYLVEGGAELAVQRMRKALTALLKHAGVDPSQKYHETLTEAWILAVHHSMKNTDNSESADGFIEKNTVMLDSKIMMTHYSAEVLFSEQARQSFVEPNLDPIPGHGK